MLAEGRAVTSVVHDLDVSEQAIYCRRGALKVRDGTVANLAGRTPPGRADSPMEVHQTLAQPCPGAQGRGRDTCRAAVSSIRELLRVLEFGAPAHRLHPASCRRSPTPAWSPAPRGTNFLKNVEPEGVAKAIAGAIEKKHKNFYLPKSLHQIPFTHSLTGRRVRHFLNRRLGAYDKFLDIDQPGRVAYNERINKS